MNALAHHDVGQGDACGQHSHAHFTTLRRGALFSNRRNLMGPAVVSDDDARVFHGPSPGAAACAVENTSMLNGRSAYYTPRQRIAARLPAKWGFLVCKLHELVGVDCNPRSEREQRFYGAVPPDGRVRNFPR